MLTVIHMGKYGNVYICIHVLGSVFHGSCLVWVQRVVVVAAAAFCGELL